jgi:hypothetical protein
MGTTESVFYEEPSGQPPRLPSRNESGSPPPMTHQGTVTKYPTNEIALPVESSRPKNGTQHRKSLPPQEEQSPQVMRPSVKPIHRLEGLVVGTPKTGKRCLLQRLQGKDPFQKQAYNDPSGVSSYPNVIIPYKPPPESLSLDRIQLHIQCKTSSDRFEQYYRNQTVHFLIVLVNPKHNLDTTRSFLENAVTMHLDSLDYPSERGRTNTEGEGKGTSQMERNRSDDKNPVCICFLFNFRDISKENFPRRGELERSIDEIMKQKNVPDEKIAIEWIDVSLRNCYGLNHLHTFIYKTYLLRKEAELQAQLHAVQNQIRVTQSIDKPLTTYDEFLDRIESKKDTQQPSSKANGHKRQPVLSNRTEESIEQPNEGKRHVEAPLPRTNFVSGPRCFGSFLS